MLDATLTQITDALLLGAPHATSALKAAAARYASPNLDEILAHVQPPHDPKSAEAQEGIAASARSASRAGIRSEPSLPRRQYHSLNGRDWIARRA